MPRYILCLIGSSVDRLMHSGSGRAGKALRLDPKPEVSCRESPGNYGKSVDNRNATTRQGSRLSAAQASRGGTCTDDLEK